MRLAVYPGSFDPVTNGHLDIIERALFVFDILIVAVSRNSSKQALFTVAERMGMLSEVLSPYSNVKIDSFEGLTVNYALEKNAHAIIRGLRVISDFENEFKMALANKKLASQIETVFLMTRAEYAFLSSSTVKEMAFYDSCARDLVPEIVARKLHEKFLSKKKEGDCTEWKL